MVAQLESYKTDNSLIVVDRRCFEKDINYFTDKHIMDSKKEFVMIYDSSHPERYKEGTLDLASREGELFEDVMAPAVCARRSTSCSSTTRIACNPAKPRPA